MYTISTLNNSPAESLLREYHLYVNTPSQSPNFSDISAALAFLEEKDTAFCSTDKTIETATHICNPSEATTKPHAQEYPAPMSALPRAIIHIAPGIYREKLVISRPNVTFLGCGEKPEDVVLVYGEGAFEIMPEGDKRGTFRTATVRVDAQDFTACNLTFQNDAGPGYKVGQALALYVDGDRAYFENCRMLGSQDTIFTAPLPEQEFQPGGFKGPGEHKPRTMTRQYYKNCYIEGDVDFIFGSAICYFEGCEIFSRAREDLKPTTGTSTTGTAINASAPTASNAFASTDANASSTHTDTYVQAPTPIHGYITAASTPESAKYGYVFMDCRLLSDCPAASVYLGRPWREFAKTVFLDCYLGEHIHPEGWNDWKKTHGHFYYGEYHSYGPGASPDTRAEFSHRLDETDLELYSPAKVLNGWVPQ